LSFDGAGSPARLCRAEERRVLHAVPVAALNAARSGRGATNLDHLFGLNPQDGARAAAFTGSVLQGRRGINASERETVYVEIEISLIGAG